MGVTFIIRSKILNKSLLNTFLQVYMCGDRRGNGVALNLVLRVCSLSLWYREDPGNDDGVGLMNRGDSPEI